jgi:hypothetical protein
VDDGSKDNTAKAAFEFVRKHSLDVVRVIKLGHNQGKGAAVQRVSLDRLKLSGPHLQYFTSVKNCFFSRSTCNLDSKIIFQHQLRTFSAGNVHLVHGTRTSRKVCVEAG